MSKSQKIEKNIYREVRGQYLRFVVAVAGQKRYLTFDLADEATVLAQARRVRDELSKQKSKPVLPLASTNLGQVACDTVQSKAIFYPSNISLKDVFDNYRNHETYKLTGEVGTLSRLSLLEKWFGHLTLGQLDYNFIERWKHERAAGVLGSGRPPRRAPEEINGKLVIDKHTRYRMKKAGQSDSVQQIYPVSSQTMRHELRLLRTCLNAYFNAHMSDQKAWLKSRYIMEMSLPAAAEPRHQRIPDEHLKAILAMMPKRYRIAIAFDVLQGLRRGELVSLRWSDYDEKKHTISLRPAVNPNKKTKVNPREIPLLEGSIRLLEQLPRDGDLIFPFERSTLSQAWRRAADAAGFYGYRLHDIRREALSNLVDIWELGAEQIMMFSGHADLGTLVKHYLKPNAASLAKKMLQAGREIPSSVSMLLCA